MIALLRANVDAGRMKWSDIPEVHRDARARQPGIVRGAPTHDLAYLLHALEDMGWKLVEEVPDDEDDDDAIVKANAYLGTAIHGLREARDLLEAVEHPGARTLGRTVAVASSVRSDLNGDIKTETAP